MLKSLLVLATGLFVLQPALEDEVDSPSETTTDWSEEASSQRRIPLAWLRMTPPAKYRLATGDVVSIVIVGHQKATCLQRPVDRGAVRLPTVGRVKVNGMSLAEAGDAILAAVATAHPDAGISVSLLQARQVRIVVIREDVNAVESAHVIRLPAARADVLSALSRTGGLPSPTKVDDVLVIRKQHDMTVKTRIPLMAKPANQRPFPEDAIRLGSGDVVFVGRNE